MTRDPTEYIFQYFLKVRDIFLKVSDLWNTKSESENDLFILLSQILIKSRYYSTAFDSAEKIYR